MAFLFRFTLYERLAKNYLKAYLTSGWPWAAAASKAARSCPPEHGRTDSATAASHLIRTYNMSPILNVSEPWLDFAAEQEKSFQV